MKKLFTVELQVGNNEWAKNYSVIAPNMPAAIIKGIRQAKRDTRNKSSRWRCTHANENKTRVL